MVGMLPYRSGTDMVQQMGFCLASTRWTYDNEAGEKHWERHNVKCVLLEDLVTDFESTMRSVFTFVGEEFDPIVTTYNQHHPHEECRSGGTDFLGSLQTVAGSAAYFRYPSEVGRAYE
jgi:hypothetical protein